MCADVQILFPHKKQDDSVISLQRFKLLGLGSMSNVAPKQNEIKEEGIGSNFSPERSFFTKSHHLEFSFGLVYGKCYPLHSKTTLFCLSISYC